METNDENYPTTPHRQKGPAFWDQSVLAQVRTLHHDAISLFPTLCLPFPPVIMFTPFTPMPAQGPPPPRPCACLCLSLLIGADGVDG